MALNASLPDDVIQSFVAQQDRASVNVILQPAPSFFATRSADLKNVGKIGPNGERKWNLNWRPSVVHDLEFLVTDVPPKKFGAQQVDRPALDD